MKSCIVLSIPRAGTHLVMKLLKLLGLEEYYPLATSIPKENWENKFKMPNEGFFCFGAHMPYSLQYSENIQNKKLKAVYITRDLRDIVVSLVFFYMKISTHPLHNFFINLPSMDERIKYCILGSQKFTSIFNRYKERKGWYNDPNVCLISFEKLIGKKGEGSDKLQEEEINKICEHLQIPKKNIKKLTEKLWGKEPYILNFRKGIIGDWKNYFTKEHKELFKKLGGQLLIDLGYEKDLKW